MDQYSVVISIPLASLGSETKVARARFLAFRLYLPFFRVLTKVNDNIKVKGMCHTTKLDFFFVSFHP